MEAKKEVTEEKEQRKLTGDVPQQTIYHLDGLDYLLLKTTPESCEYIFYDRYLRETMRGEIELSGEPEILREEVLRQQGRLVENTDVIPEAEFEKLQTFVSGEPMVRITYTESKFLEKGQVFPFSEANQLLDTLDKKTREKYGEEPYYDKTGFEIEYMKYGRIYTYSGRYDLGDGDGTLAAHIEQEAVHGRTDPEWQAALAKTGKEFQRETNEKYDYVIEDLIPYLNIQESLGKIERRSQAELAELKKNGIPENAVFEYKDYYLALREYVRVSHMALNCEENWRLPEAPELADYVTKSEKESMEAYRKRVEKEIAEEAKAAGMTVEEYVANDYEPYASSQKMEVSKETAVEEHAAGGYEKQEKKSAEHLSAYLQTLIAGSVAAENGIYTMNAEELPYASLLLLKEECIREGISDHIIFEKNGDVVGQNLADIYKISESAEQRSYDVPEIKKSIVSSM